MLDAPIRGRLIFPMTLRRRLRRSFKRIGALLRPNTGGPLNAALLRPRAHDLRQGPWQGSSERQLLQAIAAPIVTEHGSSGAVGSSKAANAQGYPTANIVVEPEHPGNPRSLFRVYAFGRVYEEGLTAAQTHALVGDLWTCGNCEAPA